MDDYDDLASTTYDWNFDSDQGNFDLTSTGIASTTVEEIPKAADENFLWNILDDYGVDSCTFGIAGTPIASTTSKEKPKADEHRANSEKIIPSLDSCTFGIAGTPIASTTSKEKPKADEHRATTGKIIPSLVFPAWVESAPDEDQTSFRKCLQIESQAPLPPPSKRKIFREFIEGDKQKHEEMSETRKHRVEAAKASLHESRVMNGSLKKEFNEMTIKLRQALEEEKNFQEHLETVCKEENKVESRLTEIREQARQLEAKEKAFDLYDKHVGASVVNIRKDCICLLQRANELLESDKLTEKLAQFEAAALQT